MGMFDDLKCRYPLPLDGANELDYQTKDTDAQYLDLYEIREDGTLWHESYDIEDHSDASKCLPDGTPTLASFAGCMTRVNKRWEKVPLTGEISFYTMYQIKSGKLIDSHNGCTDGWIQWSAYFVEGKLNQIHLIENRKPTTREPT